MQEDMQKVASSWFPSLGVTQHIMLHQNASLDARFCFSPSFPFEWIVCVEVTQELYHIIMSQTTWCSHGCVKKAQKNE